MKKLFSIILTIIFLYAVFVLIDCFRLKNADEFTKPFVLIETKSTQENMTFTGLGYKVEYKIDTIKQSSDLEFITASESKFILFDTFTLWEKKYTTE